MTCRPELIPQSGFVGKGAARLLAFALPIVLAACGGQSPDADPINLAQRELQQGNGLGAETVLRRALAEGEVSRPEIAAFMGEAELRQDKLTEARHWLAPAEFDDASRAHGFHMLGRLEMAEGNLPAAGAAFDKAFVEGGEHAELWVDVGRLRYRGGEQQQAVEAADRAISVGPGNPAALSFKGQLVRDAFGSRASLPWFSAGLKSSPNSPDLLVDSVATLGDAGQGRKALKFARRLARATTDDRRNDFLQAVIAARGERPELAQNLLQRSQRAKDGVPAAMLLSAATDMQIGNLASASQTLERLHELQPENRLIEIMFARSLALGRNESELVYRFAEKARRPSASPYLVTLVGRAYEAMGDRRKAAWYLDRAASPRSHKLLAMQPSGLVLDTDRGEGNHNSFAAVRALIVEGKSAEAVRVAKSLSVRFPGSTDALNLAGDAQLANGKAKEALKLYERAAQVRRNWPLVKRMIAAHRAEGAVDDAERLLASYLRGDPGNAEAATMLAGILATKGDWRRVAPLVDHAMSHGASRDAVLLSLRSRAAAGTGERANARAFALRAYELQPMSGLSAQMLASLSQEGADKEALLRKARKLTSDAAE